MNPSLTLPERRTPPGDLEIRPGKVRAWIEALPLANVNETARTLQDYLVRLNAAELPADQRIEILDAMRPIARSVIDQLVASYSRTAPPLKPRAHEAYVLSRSLAHELSVGHTVAVVQKMAKFFGKKRVPALLHNAIEFAAIAIRASYRAYAPVTPGDWKSLHELYLYAEHHHFENEPESEAKGSINEVYCEALLLALCDPYRFAPGEIERILFHLAGIRAPLPLSQSVPTNAAAPYFLVPCDTDRPPRPKLSSNDDPGGPNWRLLDTSSVVEKLRARRKSLEGRNVPAATVKAMGADAVPLLGRMIVLLSVPTKRSLRREEGASTVEICVGLATLAQIVSSQRSGENLDVPVSEWLVADQGTGGIKVRCETVDDCVLSVGEVVGIRRPEIAQWTVGVVRWITMTGENGLDAGIKFVSAGARPIAINPAFAPKPQASVALVLDHDATGGEVLLAPPNTYEDRCEYEIEEQGEVARVRATHLVEKNARFELFQVWPA